MIDLRAAADAFARLVELTADDQLDRPTPCTEMTVGDLVDHVDLVARGSVALVRRDQAELDATAKGPVVVHDVDGWQATVADHVRAVAVAWSDPEVWERPEGLPGSGLANETWGKIALTELVVHGWDLAQATGQPFALDDATLQACLDHVAVFIPNAPVPGLWDPPVDVPDDAPLLDRIIAINGRTP